MKLTTLRNLMASMLVLGVAGSVIAVGNGTFALFNATTTSPGNTFTTDDLILNENNTGACTAKASVASGAASSCTFTIGVSQMIPGDSKFGSFYIENDSSKASFDLNLAVTAPTSTLLDQTAPNDATSGGGLGLFLFSCLDGSGKPVSCGGTVTTIHPIYGSCVGGDVTLGTPGAFSASTLSVTGITNETIKVNGVVCTPGNDASSIKTVSTAVAGPDTSSHFAPHTGAAGSTPASSPYGIQDMAMVINLPVSAKDTFAGGISSSLSVAWTATQIVGSPS